MLVISPSSWRSSLTKHRRVIAPWFLFIVTAAAAGAAVLAGPVFLVIPIALLPVIATWAYPTSVWPFVPLAAIVISPAIFLVDGKPFENGDATQKVILIIAALCLAMALGLCWSWVGAAAMAILGGACLASILDIGGRVEVTSDVLARATATYCVPFLFFFINWRRLNLQKGLEYLAALPLVCLVAGVVLQIAGVKGPWYRAPLPGIYQIDEGVPRLQGASIAAHLAMLALVGLVAALSLSALPNHHRVRVHFWVGLNFVILMATVTRAEIAVGILLVLTYIVVALVRNRMRTLHIRRAIWPIAAVAVLTCAIAAPALILRSTGSRYQGTFNTSGRTYAWELLQGFVAENPLTGKGLGFSSIAIKLYYSDYVSERFADTFRAPHNEYLRFMVDGGVFFALGLFLVILAAFVIAARAQTGAVKALVVMFALGTIALSYVDNTFSAMQFSVPLVMFLCLLAAHPTSGRNSPGRHRANVRDHGDDSSLETETDPGSPAAAHESIKPIAIRVGSAPLQSRRR